MADVMQNLLDSASAYAEVVDDILSSDRVVVVGPQRSGTHLVAQALAVDGERLLVEENDFGINSLSRFVGYLSHGEKMVFQAPGLFHLCEMLDFDSMCVVVVVRPTCEIVESSKRHRKNATGCMVRYFVTVDTERQDESVELQYRAWTVYQVPYMKCASFVVNYHSMAEHRLWVPQEERRFSHAWQTANWQTSRMDLYHR